jgi:hypothetical protein
MIGMTFGKPPGGKAMCLTDAPDPPQEIFVKNFTSSSGYGLPPTVRHAA